MEKAPLRSLFFQIRMRCYWPVVPCCGATDGTELGRIVGDPAGVRFIIP